jgi:cytochrome c-type biogenesis protein CcmH/NrfG
MNYFVERPQYTSQNPRQSEFMSTAYYMRGIIYLDHSDGLGRLDLALKNFTAALKWQPENNPALLGLARVYMVMGRTSEAVEAVKLLLSKNPPALLKNEAEEMLKKLASPVK